MRVAPLRASVTLALVAALLTACGGGSSSAPGAAPQPPPTVAPFPRPLNAQNAATVPLGTAPSTQKLPTTGGIIPTLILPAASGSASLNVTVMTGAEVSPAAQQRSTKSILPLPGGPYLAQIYLVSDKTVTLAGAPGASFDLGPFINSDQNLALQFLSHANGGAPFVFYGAFEDSAGQITTAGPLTLNGTVITFSGTTTSVTLTAGAGAIIGVALGPITLPTAAPTATPTATPTPTPTATPTPVPTATPTPVPTATPTPVATATPTSSASGTILGGGATVDAANGVAGTGALMLPYAGGFSGALGYPANSSNVVTVASQSFNGYPQGGPTPPQGTTVDYAVTIALAGGPPGNQTAFAFNNSGTVSGFLNIPFVTTSTYTLYVYAPSVAGTMPVYVSPSAVPTQTGPHASRLTYSSPLNNLSTAIPLPQTLYAYFTRP